VATGAARDVLGQGRAPSLQGERSLPVGSLYHTLLAVAPNDRFGEKAPSLIVGAENAGPSTNRMLPAMTDLSNIFLHEVLNIDKFLVTSALNLWN